MHFSVLIIPLEHHRGACLLLGATPFPSSGFLPPESCITRFSVLAKFSITRLSVLAEFCVTRLFVLAEFSVTRVFVLAEFSITRLSMLAIRLEPPESCLEGGGE
jgi:hypothetical protein